MDVAHTCLSTHSHKLDHNLADTVYAEMVDKIYKELTILGVISFMVFIFLQSGAVETYSIETSIVTAFEFSHVVIFFAAVVFVIESFFMMVVNDKLKQQIDAAAATSSAAILEYYEKNKASINRATSVFVPSAFCTTMEYKALNIFFCDQYHLPLSVFDFPAYVREVLDHNILSLIEVDVSSWLVLCFLLMLLAASSEAGSASDTDDARRRLAGISLNGNPVQRVHDYFAGLSGSERRLGETVADDGCADAADASTDYCGEVTLHTNTSEYDCTHANTAGYCDYSAADDTHEEACTVHSRRAMSSYAEVGDFLYLNIPDTPSSWGAEERLGSEVFRFLADSAADVGEEQCDPCALSRRLAGDATAAVCDCVTEVHRKLGGDAACVTCPTVEEADAHRRLGEATGCVDPCAISYKDDGMTAFIAFGWLLLALAVVLAILSRRAQRKLFGIIGLHTWDDKINYIEKSEKILKEKDLAMQAELQKIADEEHEAELADSTLSASERADRKTLKETGRRHPYDKESMLKKLKEDMSLDGHDHGHGHDPLAHDATLNVMKTGVVGLAGAVGLVGALDAMSGAAAALTNATSPNPLEKRTSFVAKKYLLAASDAKVHPGGEHTHEEHEHGTAKSGGDTLDRQEDMLKAAEQEINQTIADSKKGIKKKKGIDLSSVYLFNSPLLFNKLLDMCLLLNCFYIAVFCGNYLLVAMAYGGSEATVAILLCLVPALVFYPFVVVITQQSSVLSAIATLDATIVGHVIDETEDMLNIQHEVFDTFREKMAEMGLDSEDLKDLFLEIDTDHSGEVDAKELQTGLALLGMHFSAVKFKRLFRAVDKDRSGAINFEEFFHLVYPDEKAPM